MNNVNIAGRVAKDPDTRGSVTTLIVATDRVKLRDGKTYSLAQQFPLRDKDMIFVAEAPGAQIYSFFTALNSVTGPIITGLLVCGSAQKC